MQPDRREQCRVDVGEGKELEVSVRASGRPSFSGQAVDLSVDGAGLRVLSLGFPPSAGPVLGVGEETELTLTFAALKKELVVSARVTNRTDEEESRRYGFQFTNRQQLEEQLWPALYRFFNRRAAYRVEPAPDCPVEVTLERTSGGMRVQAPLLDISAGGMGLRVPAEAESAFAESDRIRVSTSLPGCREPLNLTAIIRNRRLAGAEVHYGLEFDWPGTENRQRQQDAIIAFVMKRQRADLAQKSAAHNPQSPGAATAPATEQT